MPTQNSITQSNTTESIKPIKPPRKRSNDISSLNNSFERINFENKYTAITTYTPATTYTDNVNISELSSTEINLRTQSLLNLNNLKQQQQIHSKIDCDITRSINDVSQLKSKSNHKERKWYKKFLSVSSIFDSSTKKNKKHSSKSKLTTVTS